MQFVLISRHTGGACVPEAERERNLQEMGEWMRVLRPRVAMPTRGGVSVTAGGSSPCDTDIGGVLVFEADDLDHAIALARRSPGLRHGFTHEVFPERSIDEAARAD